VKQKNVNPLNVHKVRRAAFCPPYFESALLPSLSRVGMPREIDDWVYKNMTGRYFIGRTVNTTDTGSISVVPYIAFENPSELSIFMLSCPYLK